MEGEPPWTNNMDRLQTPLSYKHLVSAAAATDSQSSDQHPGLSILQHNRHDHMSTPAILDLHAAAPSGGYSQLQPTGPFDLPLRDGYLGCMDASLPNEDLCTNTQAMSNLQTMQSLRDFMVVSNFANPTTPASLQYSHQEDDHVNLLDPRTISAASLPFYFSLVDDASASPSTSTQPPPNSQQQQQTQLRALGNRPETAMNYRNLCSGEMFGTERSPHRTQLQRESHILAERQRREEMNEKFTILRSMIPKLTKKDKASIVTDTINYIKELEKKVSYLQACKGKAKGYLRPVQRNIESSPSAAAQEQRGINLESNLKEIVKVADDLALSTGDLPNGNDADIKTVRLGHVEIQDLGSQAVIKVLSPRSRGVVLRLHLALEECKVDVIQSNVTTVGDKMVHFVTVGLNPGVSANTNELIAALRLASSPPALS